MERYGIGQSRSWTHSGSFACRNVWRGHGLDAYYAAFRVPDLVYSFLVLGRFRPDLFRTSQNDGKKDAGVSAWRFTNAVLSIVSMALIVLSALGALFARPLLALIAPSLTHQRWT